jgi:hypothetical protein
MYTPPKFLFLGYRRYSDRELKLTTQVHLIPILGMTGTLHPLVSYGVCTKKPKLTLNAYKISYLVKGKAFPLQAWRDPWGSRRLRLQNL